MLDVDGDQNDFFYLIICLKLLEYFSGLNFQMEDAYDIYVWDDKSDNNMLF